MSAIIVYRDKWNEWLPCPEWQAFASESMAVLTVAMRDSVYFGQPLAVLWDRILYRVSDGMIDQALEKIFEVSKWFNNPDPVGYARAIPMREKAVRDWWDMHNRAARDIRMTGILALYKRIRQHIDNPPKPRVRTRAIWMAGEIGYTRADLGKRSRGGRPQGGMGGGS